MCLIRNKRDEGAKKLKKREAANEEVLHEGEK